MPVDKNKLIRFQALDRCFSDQVNKYYLEDLIHVCNQALKDADCKIQSISRSSIFTDIAEMTTNPNWSGAELIDRSESSDGRRRFYRYKDPHYSIWRRDLNDGQLAQLQSILLMLRQFKDFPQASAIEDIIRQFEKSYNFELEDADGVIAFESNENLDALSLVGTLFSHISHKKVLKITYQPFQKSQIEYTLHPHFLKQYNRRWFLIGLTISREGQRSRSVFPLDRIVSIEQLPGEYIPSNIELDDLFYDQIGVTLTKDDPVVLKLQFSQARFPYVLTKPIHPSQKVVSKDEGIISIEVKPNKELFQTLLSFGSDVQILEPAELKEKHEAEIEKMRALYKRPE